MKRPLLLFAIALMIGILTAQTNYPYLFFIFLLVAFVTSGIFIFIKFRVEFYILIGILLFYVTGFAEFSYVDHANNHKFEGLAGQQVIVRGTIDSDPDIRETKVLYTVKTKEIETAEGEKSVNGKILLTTLKSKDGKLYEYGTKVQIIGEINVPKGKRNPGGMDYRKFLARSGISATLFAKDDQITIGNGRDVNIFVKAGLDVRTKIINVINRSLPKEQAGLLNGMLIGYREGLSKDVQGAFSDAGLSHIMAVSGMNVAFIVLPFVFLFNKLSIRQRAANLIIICILIVFVLITGFSPSVLRAVVMAMIVLIAQMIRRETDIIVSLSFAAILLLIYNPYTLFDIGFQLSFIATLSLVIFYERIKQLLSVKWVPNAVLDILAVTLAAQVGVIPVTAFYFNKISIISFASNLLVVPLVQIVTILGFVMAILGQFSIFLSQLIGYINNTFLTFILYTTKISASVPLAVVRVVTPSILLILLYYIGAVFYLRYKPEHKIKIHPRYYAAVVLLLMIVLGIRSILPKSMEVVFIDVGEGDSTFVRTCKGKTVLIDGGGSNSKLKTESNIGDTVIVPFLLDYGITKLDMVVATHGHDDHIQGLIPVMESLKVDNLVIPDLSDVQEFKKLLDISQNKKIMVQKCRKGNIIRLDGETYFKTIYPAKELGTQGVSPNNDSLVLKLNYDQVNILFTGDIEARVESALIETESDVKADVLKVAHHGSITSSSPGFLNAVSPFAAVISVGKNNFGHPSQVVLDRLVDNKVKLFRTDETGAVILTTNGKRVKFEKMVQ